MHTLQKSQSSLPRYAWWSRTIRQALYYFTNHHEANDVLAHIPHGPIGFDLEWRPTFRKGQPENRVALVQLATADTVILVHLHFMTRTLLPSPLDTADTPTEFPVQLARLLSSPSWIKAGVNIQYDCNKLHRDYGVSVRNCVDLSLLARTVDNARWKGKYTSPLGLSRLLETYELATLLKGKTQRSNWELPLSGQQREYAANDAHAGYVIYTHLINRALAMVPAPLPIYYSFGIVDGHLRDNLGILPWRPHNPCYDPGPPPPKPKNPDSVGQEQSASSSTELDHTT